MIRTRKQFYWSDTLYLSRTKNLLTETEKSDSGVVFRCSSCRSFVRLATFQAGIRWERVKPFEQFLLDKKHGQEFKDIEALQPVELSASSRLLYQCPVCAGYWWREDAGWNKADDEAIEQMLTPNESERK